MLYLFNKLFLNQNALVISEELILKSDRCVFLGRSLYRTQKIKSEDLEGTRFEGMPLKDIEQNELEAALYRKALTFNPNNADAVNELGMCIAEGATIEARDLKGTHLEESALQDILSIEIEAALYRRAISLNFECLNSFFNLAECLKNENIKIEPFDLVNLSLQSELSTVKRAELRAHLYRKELSLDKRHSRSLLGLTLCLGEGATILSSDLIETVFSNYAVQNIDRYKLMTELYRKVIRIKQANGTRMEVIDMEAVLYLAMDILKGMPFFHSDLKGTRFEGQQACEITHFELAAELFRQVYIFYSPQSGYWILHNLSFCILNGATLQIQDLENSPFEGMALKEVKVIEWVAFVNRMGIEKGFLDPTLDNLCKCLEQGAKLKAEDLRETLLEHIVVESISILDAIQAIKSRTILSPINETDENIDHPFEFLCPISHQLMQKPVFTCDGHVYDEAQIIEWFKTKKTSPLTNIILSRLTLIPHCSLQLRIARYIQDLTKESIGVPKMSVFKK